MREGKIFRIQQRCAMCLPEAFERCRLGSAVLQQSVEIAGSDAGKSSVRYQFTGEKQPEELGKKISV